MQGQLTCLCEDSACTFRPRSAVPAKVVCETIERFVWNEACREEICQVETIILYLLGLADL